MDNNFYYLINAIDTNEILSEEQALKYLQKINSRDFLYNNVCNYDILDYEKSIFIEMTYSATNPDIQKLITEIKNNISFGYIYKEKLKARIFSNYNLSNLYNDYDSERFFSGIPR